MIIVARQLARRLLVVVVARVAERLIVHADLLVRDEAGRHR